MSLPVVLLPVAKEEFDDAVTWYDRQRSGLGLELLQCVNEALDRISNFPEMHQVVFLDVRRGKVRRFPYSVFYYVESDRIVVLAVFHSKRDPKIWQSRR
jgi:plasmid stabilization system protein ParE